MSTNKVSNVFEAEVSELLSLMIHSIYSHKEIFLRELISNAADAIDKYKFEALSNSSLDATDYHIRLIPNEKEKTLSIVDNGIGMSYEEVLKNIGTIAHSGTKEFLSKIKEAKQNPELIGQFGIGFYSAFMVAKKVVLHTQKAGEKEGTLWESKGEGTYEISKKDRKESHGTTITLYLKDATEEGAIKEGTDEELDFTKEWTLRSTIKKYSDFIAYPIRMKVEREEPELDKDNKPIEGKTKKIIKDEVLNSQKAIWLRPSSEIKEEEYREFYHHLTHDFSEPQTTIHYKAEGTMEYTALLYIPSKRPFYYDYQDSKYGLKLYINRVFILSDCKELIPQYLRFVQGLVDSSDLSLNVSREILQKDRQVAAIQKSLTTKILNELSTILKKDREKYELFFQNFGTSLKEGVALDMLNRDKILDLVLCHSSHGEKKVTLKEYVKRMPENQKEIYYMTGDSIEQLKNSPYLEKIKEKNYETLFFIDRIDEWMFSHSIEYKDKKFIPINAKDLELDTKEEKEKKEKEFQEQKEKYKPLITIIQKTLVEELEEVKLSSRLTKSPVCLVSSGTSVRMEEIMSSMGRGENKSKRIMEINPKHPVFDKMLKVPEQQQKEWIELLYGQALLNEGSKIPNPAEYGQKVAKLMLNTPTEIKK